MHIIDARQVARQSSSNVQVAGSEADKALWKQQAAG